MLEKMKGTSADRQQSDRQQWQAGRQTGETCIPISKKKTALRKIKIKKYIYIDKNSGVAELGHISLSDRLLSQSVSDAFCKLMWWFKGVYKYQFEIKYKEESWVYGEGGVGLAVSARRTTETNREESRFFNGYHGDKSQPIEIWSEKN